ncbi:MAG: rhodanese-like domain-containing protein, partial [Nitrospina sp.]|nr:rhodanese-like domain-containing protein [Nitrospina sp.]
MSQIKIFFVLLVPFVSFFQPSISVGESLTINFKNLKSISPDNLIIIDTRSKFKYLLGHIPKAIHLGKWQDFTQNVKGVRGLLIKN